MGNKQSGEDAAPNSKAETAAPTRTPSRGHSVRVIEDNSNQSSEAENVVQEVDKAEEEARLQREKEAKERAKKKAVEDARAKVEEKRKRIEKEEAERAQREKLEAAKVLAEQREKEAKRDAENRAAEDRAALEKAKELERQKEEEEEERKRKEREAEDERKKAEAEKQSKASVLDDLLAMANDHSEPKAYEPVVNAPAPSSWNPEASGFDNSRFRKANRTAAPPSAIRAAPTPETRRVENEKRSQALLEIGDDDESLMDDILNGL